MSRHTPTSCARAYSRPEVLQFWGMEFDAPARDHHTLMIPHHSDEAQQLFELESRFAKHDAFPADRGRDTESKMIEFLKAAKDMRRKPLVIAHHASRSATGLGVYGQDTPREFRNGNNAAPEIYVGFEGAPGHQAGPLNGGARGGYGNYPTHGGWASTARPMCWPGRTTPTSWTDSARAGSGSGPATWSPASISRRATAAARPPWARRSP
ncbi:hypothetical protein ACFXBB_36595 [Streptomyces scopuliridis]|uniref:hypothetical protein n=1 Tax=Streptomyces scopuliridis TaxID=452529 RepID=UPI0036A0455C